MKEALKILVRRLDDPTVANAGIIHWSCPVPSFGDHSRATIATLGLNPSNREFVDGSGKELDGGSRRFHTLRSLGISRWSEARERHLTRIAESCRRYFHNTPYTGWFRALDRIIAGTSCSYFNAESSACHLDLIPYATGAKWTDLNRKQRSALLFCSRDALGMLLRDSDVQILILNGRTVAETLEEISGVQFKREKIGSWTLPRRSSLGVSGIAFTGGIDEVGGVKLGRVVRVLGFNHNIQSSYGVTNAVKLAIQDWVTDAASGKQHETA